MFPIDHQNLPFVQTRQALLVLDLQNDFLAPGGLLQVENSQELQERVTKIFPHFRASGGNIIHVRSCFEASRPINEPHGESESVITDKEVAAAKGQAVRRKKSSRLLKHQDRIAGLLATLPGNPAQDDGSEPAQMPEPVEETFLTTKPDQNPRAFQIGSSGINIANAVLSGMDSTKDLIIQKTWYSAFKDGSLVQILRSRFVTEIYICGALTNISVFATAMDATRHGYAITLVDDCLGYRSKERHDEALKQLEIYTGCDNIMSAELIEELKRKTKQNKIAVPPRQNQRPTDRPPRPTPRSSANSGLDNIMANLQLKPQVNFSGSPAGSVALTETSGSVISESSNESPEFRLPPRSSRAEASIHDRVRSKVKSRRRPSTSTAKEAKNNDELSNQEKSPSVEPSSSTVEPDESSSVLSTRDTSDTTYSIMSSSKPEVASLAITTLPETTQDDLAKGVEALALEKSAGAAFTIESPIEPSLVPICAGDTVIIKDLLEGNLSASIFEEIRDEVRWQRMSHQGGEVPRLIAVQGEIGRDGSIPIYRHPADESPPLLPFSPYVQLIRAEVEKKLGHQVNHVLIQIYRDGMDYISEHSDKTLDIVSKTYIANVSLGAQRTMVFRTKRPPKNTDGTRPEASQARETCRAPLPHNSMCKMGLITNERWLHGIRQDKRLLSEKTPEELAYSGGRISLTFRAIGTFLSEDQQRIWGQGAISKTKEDANNVINGENAEAEKMIRAFGQENHSSDFDWEAQYGHGFDVLHLSNSPKLFLSGDRISDLRVKLMLAEYGIAWEEGKVSPPFTWKDGTMNVNVSFPDKFPVKFVDNDLSKSTVTGDIAILLYLDTVYGPKSPKANIDLAKQFTRFQEATGLEERFYTEASGGLVLKEPETWEVYAGEGKYLAGSEISLVDFVVWPTLEVTRTSCEGIEGLVKLKVYHERMRGRESWAKVLVGKDEVKQEA